MDGWMAGQQMDRRGGRRWTDGCTDTQTDRWLDVQADINACAGDRSCVSPKLLENSHCLVKICQFRRFTIATTFSKYKFPSHTCVLVSIS